MDPMLLPPDMAPTVCTPSRALTASITASAVAKASSLAVSSATSTVMESWLLPISGIMTMPMVAMRHTDSTSRPMASPRGRALTFRQKRRAFS